MTRKDILFQIKLAMLYKNVLQKDIAEKTGINLRTLTRRFENPSGFTIDELIKISEVLDIKFEFVYNTTSKQTLTKDKETNHNYILFTNPISTPPSVPIFSCENCWYYQQRKNSNKIEFGDSPCNWCPKMQITCEAKNNDK